MCGIDGVTYGNECHIKCHGVEPACEGQQCPCESFFASVGRKEVSESVGKGREGKYCVEMERERDRRREDERLCGEK